MSNIWQHLVFYLNRFHPDNDIISSYHPALAGDEVQWVLFTLPGFCCQK